jgi:hypothetical protein
MIHLALAFGVLAFPPQDELFDRKRIEAAVQQLDAEAPDEKAAREITYFHTSAIPAILEIATADKYPRAAKRIAELLPSEPWRRFLKMSINNARGIQDLIEKGQYVQRRDLLQDAVRGLATIPPEEARTILDGMSRSKDPNLQDFGKQADSILFPVKGAPLGRLLGSPASCDMAADLIQLAGDTESRRQAVELFCRQEVPEGYAAARVLETLGAGEFVERILGVFEGKGKFAGSDWAIRILERTGGKRVERALLDSLTRIKPGNPRGYSIIRALQALECRDAGPAVRDFLAGLEKGQLKRMSEFPLIGPESAVQLVEEVRKEASPFGPSRLGQLHRHAYPELRKPALEWARDPQVKPSELKWLLPLVGAAGGREDAPFLLEKLQDPRCADGAAVGLAMIGDPGHARDVWKAWSRSTVGSFLNNSMLSFPPEALEEEIVAAITASQFLDRRVLAVARMRLSPAIRKAMFDRLLDPNPRGALWWDLPLMLEEGKDEQEKLWVEKLRTAGPRTHFYYGHFLAMRQGDASAAQALAEFLATRDGMFRDPRSALVWKACESAGDAWKKAVENVWMRKPDWSEGLVAMARWGNKDALEQLRGKPDLREVRTRILAKHGDPKAREWMLDRLSRRAEHEEEEDPAPELMDDPAFRRQLISLARCLALRNGGRTVALLADRTIPEARPLYVMGALRQSVPCLRALFRLKDPEAFGLAVRLLGSGGAYARLGSVRALEEWGGRPAVHHLAARLDDMEEAWDVQVERGESRLPYAPNPPIAVAAMAALEKLTGVKPEGTTHSERRAFWKEWYAKNCDAWK